MIIQLVDKKMSSDECYRKSNNGGDLLQMVQHKFLRKSVKLLRLAVPAVIAISITFAYSFVNIAYADKLENSVPMLAGIGVSNILINGLWFTTFNGFSGPLQTMVSQASSRGDYQHCSSVLRAALVVLVLLYIPLGLILYKIDWVMGESLLNVDAESLKYAITYTRTVMVGYFFEAIYDLEKKYLLQFGNALFPMLIQFVTLPLHVIFVQTMYDTWPDSLFGIAMAKNVSFFLNFLILHVYLAFVTRQPYRFSLFGERSITALLASVREYLRLGLPSALMTYFDFWIFTILLFLASYLGVVSNAAQVILFNIACATYAVGLGFGQAVCTLVGNNIGRGQVLKAKAYVAIGMILMQSLNFVFSLVFLFATDSVITIYSSDPDAIAAARLPL